MSAQNAEKKLIMELINREIKNGQYDSEFMKSYGLSSDVIKDKEAELYTQMIESGEININTDSISEAEIISDSNSEKIRIINHII